jgi:hypothetical protein
MATKAGVGMSRLTTPTVRVVRPPSRHYSRRGQQAGLRRHVRLYRI